MSRKRNSGPIDRVEYSTRERPFWRVRQARVEVIVGVRTETKETEESFLSTAPWKQHLQVGASIRRLTHERNRSPRENFGYGAEREVVRSRHRAYCTSPVE